MLLYTDEKCNLLFSRKWGKILADLITVKPTLGSKRNVFYLLVASPTINLLFTRGPEGSNLFKLFLIQILERSLFFHNLFSVYHWTIKIRAYFYYTFLLLSEIAMDNNNCCPIYSGILMSGSCHLEKVLNVEIGVEIQIFLIIIFFNCSKVLQFGAHSRCIKKRFF